MQFYPQAQMLLTFIAILTTISMIGWGLMAHPLKIAPKASRFFALSNGLVLLGLGLTTLRTDSPHYFYWHLADQAILLGIAFIFSGMCRLFKLTVTHEWSLYVWAGFAVIMAFIKPGAELQLYMGVIFSLSAMVNFSLVSYIIYLGIFNAFGRLPAVFMMLPTIFMALAFLGRLIVFVVFPEDSLAVNSIHSEQSVPMLWAYTVLTLLINIMMFACALARLTNKIRLLSERDQLTNLLNRRAVMRKLKSLHEHWLKRDVVYSVILFDIDKFKLINDEYGHDIGDLAIKHIAEILNKHLPSGLTSSRYGGEEFLILLPNTALERCEKIAQALRQALAQIPLQFDDRSIYITGSFGCAQVEEALTHLQVVTKADHAMFDVKHQGRNGVSCSIN
ncbi:putative domain GGDEF protein [Pseudoalteromonas luteoviolacea B = ATCC 29581]|nr:putative domain GGDEF protein [Pseudoalteromonas luteoviolacea B = ATCC 29581]